MHCRLLMLFLVFMLYALVNILVSHVGTISCLPGLNQYIGQSCGDSKESSCDETILLHDHKYYFDCLNGKNEKSLYIRYVSLSGHFLFLSVKILIFR